MTAASLCKLKSLHSSSYIGTRIARCVIRVLQVLLKLCAQITRGAVCASPLTRPSRHNCFGIALIRRFVLHSLCQNLRLFHVGLGPDHAGGVLCPCACCSRLALLRGLLRAPVSPVVEPKIVDAARSACGWSCFVFRGFAVPFCLRVERQVRRRGVLTPPGCTYRAPRVVGRVFSWWGARPRMRPRVAARRVFFGRLPQ